MALSLRQRVLFTFDEAPLGLWRLNDPIQWVLCRIQGHQPERDQCGRPEHDYCLWCGKSMPDSWKRT